MSESDSFIHEVSEEVRQDQLFALLRKWGWLIGLVLVLIVGAAGFIEWRKHAAEQSARATGDALRGALTNPDAAAQAAALGEIAQDGEASAMIARIAQAGALVAAGDSAQAGEILSGIAADPSISPVFRDLASLQRVMVLGSQIEDAERMAALEDLATEGAPFQALALEQRGLLHLENGDTAAAHEDFEVALSLAGNTSGFDDRIRQLILASGGAVPLPETEPVAASEQ